MGTQAVLLDDAGGLLSAPKSQIGIMDTPKTKQIYRRNRNVQFNRRRNE